MRGSIKQAGAVGLIQDRNDIDLQPNAWTSGNNIRFEHGVVKSGYGYVGIDYTSTADEILQALFLPTTEGDYWVYAADTDADGVADTISYYDGSTETSLTGWTTTSATVEDAVQMCTLHGHVVVTNGNNAPVSWDGYAATTAVSVLTWDGTNTWADYDGAGATYEAKVIRPYKQFLIAMNITDDGLGAPRMVHWSSLATPGNMPPSWDFSDPSEETGRTELAETPGHIIDGFEIRDQFAIFKTDAVYLAQFTGGSLVYQFQGVSKERGIIGPNCATEVSGRLLVMGQRSVYWYDGVNFADAAEGKVQDAIYASLDQDRTYLCHVVHNLEDHEVWVCYPTIGSTGCEVAHVLDYVTDTWSRRTIPQTNCAFLSASLDQPVLRIDDDATSRIDDDPTLRISNVDYTVMPTELHAAGAEFYRLDISNTADGSTQTCFVQRGELELGELDDIHMIRSVRPRATGEPFTVSIGRQAVQDGDITWEYSGTFTPGTDYKLDCRVTSRLHALRISSAADVHWEFSGIDIDYEIVGRR